MRADSRRAGLGRRLYGEFETLVRHRGATALEAISIPTNHDSIAFHRALDMSATEVVDYSGSGQPRVCFGETSANGGRRAALPGGTHRHSVTLTSNFSNLATVLGY